MDNLPEELIFLLLEYLSLDIKSIVALSSCDRYLLKRCREKRVLIDYYRSLFPAEFNITRNSTHLIPTTYHNCGNRNLNGYNFPGWNNIHDVINTNSYGKCNIIEHYSDVEIVPKKVVWKNLFKKCIIRSHTINKPNNDWTIMDSARLTKAKEELKKLEDKKIKNLNFKKKYSIIYNIE